MTAHAPSPRRVGLVRGLPALVALLLLPSASPAAVAIDASISSPLGPDVLVLTGFRGQEGLSRLFAYQLEMVLGLAAKFTTDPRLVVFGHRFAEGKW